MKTTTLLVFIFHTISIVHGSEVKFLPCGDDSWISYGDEKCVKLFKTFLPRTQAQEHCSQQASISDTPSLVTIKSAGEQLFLNEYVFNSSESNSVWIGAERRPGSETEFVWVDGSPVQHFTNWRVGSPSNIVGRHCVQMVTKYTRQLSNLEWVDTSCNGGASWFICQKLQAWSIEQLQRIVLATRRELHSSIEHFTDLITEMRNLMTDMRNETTSTRKEMANIVSEIANIRNEMTDNSNLLRNEMRSEVYSIRNETAAIRNEMNNNSSELGNELRNELRIETTSVRNEMRTETTNVRTEMTTMRNSLNGQLQTLQSNPVPIGYIYVQLSGQSEPRNIWPTVSWTEVTSQYAGLFFRAQGGGSAGFGSVQEAFSPRITQIDVITIAGRPRFSTSFPLSSIWDVLTIGRWSNVDNEITNWALQFTESSGEIRPRNSAIRIWRRNQ